MKGGKVELREAHKSVDGAPSHCCLVWDGHGERIVTAGPDSTVIIHPYPLSSSSSSVTLRQHNYAVTALAVSPNSTSLASASRSVKLFTFPGGEFERDVSRFTLPIRSLAFNKSGSLLAAAGDDDGIKLISAIDGSVVRVLKGHKGPVTSLSFDPKDEYLASVDGYGTVIFWELSSGNSVNILEKKAPNNGLDMTILNGLSWRPDGEMLAVPGLKNEVVMYDRDTAEKLFTLKGGHLEQVTFLSWSPNGNYLATCGLDRQVLIWDVEQKQDIDKRKFDNRICSMAWRPKENGLAVIDIIGKFGVWEGAVPSHMKSPVEGSPSVRSLVSELFPPDEEENHGTGCSGSLDQIGGDDDDLDAPVDRKRLHKRSYYKDDSDEDSSTHLGPYSTSRPHKKPNARPAGRERAGSEELVSSRSGRSKMVMQDAFQPGSTPIQDGKRHFLCYNMIGSITSLQNGESSHVEVDFHDTGRGYRVPSMTDYFGFTMAALNDHGCVFANPCRGEKNTSTLMYRPFSSWANNSEWSMRFDMDEEVRNVALGVGWIAAVTSHNFLRIFTEGGLQNYVLSVDGPVVATAGHKDELVIVTHASECLPNGDQVLEFNMLDISKRTLITKGRLPLTPGSYLTWLGFSEEGLLSSYDSKGVLRVYIMQYANSWVPCFSAAKERKAEGEHYWVVGLNSTKVFCIICGLPDIHPQVAPKPVLTPFSLACPLASSDLGADDLEKEFMMNNLYIVQAEGKIAEMAALGLDTTLQDEEILNLEASLDRCILKLIASCCKGDKLVRATELARHLLLEKSLNGAIKLVTAMKLPVLAERFTNMLEVRLLDDSQATTSAAVTRETIIPVCEPQRSFAASDGLPSVPSPVASISLPSPVFAKMGQPKIKDETTTEKTSFNNSSESNGKDMSDPVLRPSNPFAKASSVQERSSLFDSIKQMKKADLSSNKVADEHKRKESSLVKEFPKPKKPVKK
ncbi:WD repeat and HMG-box DNA-binding protein 1 [Nymphaea thermarum]|nr:WD repeat and HMG-box DNA-binding protein 1 [Nymphaea thermarum]